MEKKNLLSGVSLIISGLVLTSQGVNAALWAHKVESLFGYAFLLAAFGVAVSALGGWVIGRVNSTKAQGKPVEVPPAAP